MKALHCVLVVSFAVFSRHLSRFELANIAPFHWKLYDLRTQYTVACKSLKCNGHRLTENILIVFFTS